VGVGNVYQAFYDDGTNGTRDRLGRITMETETIADLPSGSTTRTFEYDYVTPSDMIDRGRLEVVHIDGGDMISGGETVTYTYDDNGNRLSRVKTEYNASMPSSPTEVEREEALFHIGSSSVPGADDQDRLDEYGVWKYVYDRAGDLASKVSTVNTDEVDYTYDELGNLMEVDFDDGTTVITYIVDGFNRRIGKEVDSTLTDTFLYADQLSPIAWKHGTEATAFFVYGTRPNVPDYMVKDGVAYRIFSDHLGSPRLVVDEDGTIVQRTDYDAFGRTTDVFVDTGFTPIPFGFAGGLYDRDTGLVRFGARDYDPYTGRWTTKDPILFAGGDANLYGYVLGDPVNLVDAEGTNPLVIAAALLGGTASAFGTAITGGDLTDVAIAFGTGAAIGAFQAAFPTRFLTAVLGNGAAALLQNFRSQVARPNQCGVDGQELAAATLSGVVGGFAGGRLTPSTRLRFNPNSRFLSRRLANQLNARLDLAVVVSPPNFFRSFTGGLISNFSSVSGQ